jgi:hypothetical protein
MIKIERVIQLQNSINSQIDTIGEADHDLCDELDNLIDTLSLDESGKLVDLYIKLYHNQEDEHIQREIEFLREGQDAISQQWDM